VKSFKEIIDGLPSEKRATLIYALNNGISQHVEYEPDRFIGVHFKASGPFKEENHVGSWTEGSIVRNGGSTVDRASGI